MNYKEERLKAGMTQLEVADAIDATQAQVSGWERGAFQPNPQMRKALQLLYSEAAAARARQARLDEAVLKKLDELLKGASEDLRKRMLRRILEAKAGTLVPL